MELKSTLRAISDDARGWLNVWAKDFTETEALEPTPDGRAPNPLAWQLGHIACVEDAVAQFFWTHPPPEPLVPSALRLVCGTGSPAPTGTTRYLPLAELWDLLTQTHARLLGLLEAAEPADLDRSPLRKILGKTRIG